MGLFNKFRKKEDKKADITAPGWDAITMPVIKRILIRKIQNITPRK
ncbi:MAG: hypothetical protein ACOX78_09505 [Lachnospiraceae bacterium]|jgi:hypothetical protein